MRLPAPRARLAVAHSPTPSSVRIAASSNGDGKNALAAWDSWCSVNTKRFAKAFPSPLRISRGRCSFCRSHTGIARAKDRKLKGAKARCVSSRRSNLSTGLS
jgi:hypothetical protein